MGAGDGWPGLIWHTYPLGVTGADQAGRSRNPSRTLGDLVEWLPHVAELGADTLLLGPVFASLSHGYDTVDHRVIDERLGTSRGLGALVSAATARGVGVVLDGAFAYVSRRFWRVDDPAERGEGWLLRDAAGQPVPWRVESLITPDYSAAGYRRYVAEVMTRWLDRGVRGWRLDSAWSAPASFWRPVLTEVRRRHPGAWLLGQVFDDDLPGVVNGTPYSAATEYALMHGVRAWLAGGPAESIVSALQLHGRNCGRSRIVHTFIGNHDFARIADVVGAQRVAAALAIMLTLPGLPAIYYGDEYGLGSELDARRRRRAATPAAAPRRRAGHHPGRTTRVDRGPRADAFAPRPPVDRG